MEYIWQGCILFGIKAENFTKEEYKNSKYFYLALKMRSLSRLIYLYNYYNVSILCEIFENQFEMMHRTYLILVYVVLPVN